jgi:hypothetical protein
MTSPHVLEWKDALKNLPEIARENLARAIAPWKITHFRGISGKIGSPKNFLVSIVSEGYLAGQIRDVGIKPFVFRSPNEVQEWIDNSSFSNEQICVCHPIASDAYVVYPLGTGIIQSLQGIVSKNFSDIWVSKNPDKSRLWDKHSVRKPE